MKFLVPIVTPFNKDGTVNYEALKKLTRKLLDDGADGIYACGSSAECFLLTDEERKKTLETVVKAADGANVIAHIGAVGTYRSIEFAKHAEKCGANGISSVPPFYFSYNNQEIKNYYWDLANSVKIPLTIYYIPVRTGGGVGADDLVEIINGNDNIDSIKFTDKNYQIMQTIKKKTGAFIYSGADECYNAAIAMGADGAIGTTFNNILGLYKDIYKAFSSGDTKLSADLQYKSVALINEMVKGGVLAGTKRIIKEQGIDVGTPRKPFRELTKEQEESLIKTYYELFK